MTFWCSQKMKPLTWTTYDNLLLQHEIMLSRKKCIFIFDKIEFLGMTILKRSYKLQQHIAKQLLDFLDENFTAKQVQQFLGVINYMVEFVPKLASIIKLLQVMLRKDTPS